MTPQGAATALNRKINGTLQAVKGRSQTGRAVRIS